MSRNRSRYQEKNPPFIKPLHPRTDRQAEYLEALRRADQVVVMGPAGTGKTYIASALAASLMLEGKIDRIILTRPNVPAGRSLGALPGTLEEKIAPWVIPFTDVIKEYMGYDRFNIAMKKKNIDVVPFEVMRGRTFDNAFVILDEAQNTTPEEMKMFLTRTGEDSTVVINGDIEQSDLRQDSGLKKLIEIVERQDLPVPVVQFTLDDIVRSDACAMWVKAFSKVGI